MMRASIAFVVAFTGLVSPFSPPALAQAGDLTVTPTRAVFEGRTRAVQISLVNRGAAEATYRISFARLRMTEEGRFEEIADPLPGERFADRLIRYSPRQVSLPPGAKQIVRLLLRKPADLEAGEYRSHLTFHAIPSPDLGARLADLELDDEQIGVRLIPIYQVRLPVIVRHGDLAAEAILSGLELVPGSTAAAPVVAADLGRRGERSLFGDLEVSFFPADGGPGLVVGEVDGLAVYAPNTSRRLLLPLTLPDGVTLERGRLRVAFSEKGAGEVPGAVRAAQEIVLSAPSG